MAEKFDSQEINEASEVFIFFSLATLYSCACPIAMLIVMIHHIIDMNVDLRINYTTTRRPIQKIRTNIGPWLTVVEFMAVAAVISNCLLLYLSTPRLKEWIEDTFNVRSQVILLWIIVAIEHVIITLKAFC